MNDPRTALVLGATGLVGHHLVNELLKDLTYQKVRLLNRRPAGFTDPRIEEHVLDLTSLPESSEWFVADDLFIAFGTTIKKAGSQENFQEIDLEIRCLSVVKRLLCRWMKRRDLRIRHMNSAEQPGCGSRLPVRSITFNPPQERFDDLQ